MADLDEWGFKSPRWERELDKPEPTVAVYLTVSSVKTLKYYLAAVTRYDGDLSLSDAIDMLGNEWNKLDGKRLRCENRHQPFEGLITKKIAKKHRKCTKKKCKRDDYDHCPTYVW